MISFGSVFFPWKLPQAAIPTLAQGFTKQGPRMVCQGVWLYKLLLFEDPHSPSSRDLSCFSSVVFYGLTLPLWVPASKSHCVFSLLSLKACKQPNFCFFKILVWQSHTRLLHTAVRILLVHYFNQVVSGWNLVHLKFSVYLCLLWVNLNPYSYCLQERRKNMPAQRMPPRGTSWRIWTNNATTNSH